MYVQNGERPRWAWDGQHVQVSMAWEITPVGTEPAPAAELPGVAVTPAPAPAAESAAEGRPAWSWGGAA